MHSSTVWQRHHSKPEVLYRLHHLDELLKIDRLDDVAVGVEPIGFEDVFLGLRGRQNHHGNRAQVDIGFDLCQYFTSVFSGEIDSRMR